MRRSRLFRCRYTLVGLVAVLSSMHSAEAMAPLALLGKTLVVQVIQSYLDSNARELMAEAAGPCKSSLVRGVAGAARYGLTDLPQAIVNPIRAMFGRRVVTAATGLSSDQQDMLTQLVERARERARAESSESPAEAAPITAALAENGPLDAADTEELAGRMSALARAFPDTAKCSPAEIHALVKLTALTPANNLLRPMLAGLREMDSQRSAASDAFGRMVEQDKRDAVTLISATASNASERRKRALVELLDADLLGVPPDVRASLRAAQ